MRSKYKGKLQLILLLIIVTAGIVKAQAESQDSSKSSSQQRFLPYGTQSAWQVSSSISTVSGRDLEKNFTLNLANTLYGRLPGLTVMQGGGETGLQSPTLRVRGLSTFGTGSGLLVIVDNVESPFENLAPEEIESITLLKDASSTAMYGSKGANGVLLVTTRRGAPGQMRVGFSTQHGFSSPTRLPKLLGSYDYASLYNEAQINDGANPADVKYSQADLDSYKDGSDIYFHPDIDWYDQLLRKSVPVSNYDLNVSGGTDIASYFVLLNMINTDGLYKKTKDISDYSVNPTYRRFNFRTNVDINFSKSTSVLLTLGGTVEDKANPAANNTSGIFDLISTLPPNSFPVYTPTGVLSSNLLYSNPWGDILETGFYTSNGRVFQVKLELAQKLDFITKGLSVSGQISFNSSFASLSNKSRTYQSLIMAKDPVSGNPIYTTKGLNTSLVSSESESNQWRNTILQAFVKYNRSFGSTNLDGVTLFNSSNYTYSGGGVPYRDQGLFGRYTLTNNEKYVVEFSYGFNGSEAFPRGSRWGFFPAGSLGWIVSNENFLKGNKIVNFLKIRGSYGLTGNDNIGASRRYMWLEDYVGVGTYYMGTTNTSASTITEGQLSDSSITWEKQKQMNFGLEATLFNHFDISFDLFKQNRYDILAQPYNALPSFIGISNIGYGNVFPQYNVGEVNNKGFEAMLRYRSDDSKSFRYHVQADIWYARNEIVYNAEATQLYDYLYRTGHPINQPFTLEAIGFFADQNDIDNSPLQNYISVVRPGDIKYKDQNNDNIIDNNDLYPIGNPGLPTLSGSLNLGASYKRFDLSMIFQGITGNTVMLSGNYYYAFYNKGTVSDVALDRWTPATAATATYPRLSATDNLNNFRGSSFWQRDGSYLKLRSVEIGYSLPSSLVKKIKISGARVFVNGTDLFSLDHMDFIDPENRSGYPALKTISLGIRAQL